jgi:uncharacterized protein
VQGWTECWAFRPASIQSLNLIGEMAMEKELEVCSDELLNRVQTALLANEPNTQELQEALMRELHLSEEMVPRLLYQVVRELNLSLFPAITHLELIHTEGCNLACEYCFEKNMLGHKKMPHEIACLAIDLLFDYSCDESELSITHFGGEPTLNFAGIRLATEYAEEKASLFGKTVKFDTTSNGVLLNDEMVKYFSDHNIRVLLSMDGLEKTHDKFRVDKLGRGTFKQVLKGLEILKKRQSWVGVKMTVMPQNVDSLFDDVIGLTHLGINQFLIGHATGVEWSAEAMTTYENQFGKLHRWYKENPRADLKIDDFETTEEVGYFGCQAGRNSIAVTVRGEVSPCSKIMGFSSKSLVGKMGDVWHGLTYLRNRYDLVSCSQVKSACENLGIAQDFQGGCFAVNYGESGNLFNPSLTEHAFSLLKRSACSGCSGCSR